MTTNQLKWAEIREGRRHNVAGEAETVRHNLVTEGVSRQQAEAASRQAAASAAQAAASMVNARASMAQVGLGYENLNFQKQQWDDAYRDKALAEAEQYGARGYESRQRGDLYVEQSKTEGVKRRNINADTAYTKAKTATEGMMPNYYKAKTAETKTQSFSNVARGIESGAKAVESVSNTAYKWFSTMKTSGLPMAGQYGFGWAK